jgi:WD40 repeat protein
MFFNRAMDIEVVKTATYPHVRFCILNSVLVTQQHYSGSSDLHKNHLAVMNLHNGINLYSVPSMQLIKTYSHGNANAAIFKVSFVDKGWLVSGGLDGFAQMYDVQNGQILQRLEHDSGI